MANNDLGNFLKIAVRCQDREPVLHGAGGNPDVVGGNRGTGLLQRNANGCLTPIIHEDFYYNRRYAATTSLTAGGPAARSVNILF